MSELIEALAERLFDVGAAVEVGHIEDVDFNDVRVRLAVARECLRQMEWARRCVGVSGPTTIESSELRLGEIVPTTKIVAPARPYLPNLTLAPPDWQP